MVLRMFATLPVMPGSPRRRSVTRETDEPKLIQPEDLWPDEWVEWFHLTPQERWAETEKLWAIYLALGGSLDPEPDTQSPFYDPDEPRQSPTDGRSGLRVIRRGGI